MNHPSPSEELFKLLENLPPDEPRSKLEPFRAVILRWRRQGRSYRRIQEILLEQCKVEVAYETPAAICAAARTAARCSAGSGGGRASTTAAGAGSASQRRSPCRDARTHAPVQGAARREPATEKESL